MDKTHPVWLRFMPKDVMEYPGLTLGLTLLSVAGLWSASSYGYYALVDALGLESGYNDALLSYVDGVGPGLVQTDVGRQSGTFPRSP